MPYCVVSNCTNCTKPEKKSEVQIEEEKYRKISYHKFPRDPYKRKIWLTALGINWEPPKTATVCSHHFTESDFENWTTQRILKETAVPASAGIFDQFVSDPNPISEEPTPTSTYSEVPKVVRVSSPLHTTKVDSSTSITPSRLHNCPIKKRMREAHKREITMLRRQLYSSRQQQVRYKKKIETFDTILRSLKKKNLLSLEDLDIIENFTSSI
ncbi:THAP domain-containing protein [Camponotus japonicus]